MKELQSTQVFNAIPAASKDNAAFTSKVIDTKEMAYGEFHVNVGAIDVAASELKVMESAVKTDATNLGGTPALVKDVTVKPGPADDDKIVIVGVNFVKNPRREQYIQLQSTAGDGTAGIILSATFVAVMSGEVSDKDRGADVLGTDYA